MKDLLSKYHLPKKVEVILNKSTEGGFVVEFPKLPGCFTQIDDFSELNENVTDAILTYFDVARHEAQKAVYLPETKVIKKEKSRPEFNTVQANYDLFVAA